MGYYKKKYKAPPFVMIRKDMLKDSEWLAFSSSTKIVWIYLRAKYTNKNGEESVGLTYKEANERIGLGSATYKRSIEALIKAKWLEKIKQGGLFGGWCKYVFKGKYKEFYGKKIL